MNQRHKRSSLKTFLTCQNIVPKFLEDWNKIHKKVNEWTVRKIPLEFSVPMKVITFIELLLILMIHLYSISIALEQYCIYPSSRWDITQKSLATMRCWHKSFKERRQFQLRHLLNKKLVINETLINNTLIMNVYGSTLQQGVINLADKSVPRFPTQNMN